VTGLEAALDWATNNAGGSVSTNGLATTAYVDAATNQLAIANTNRWHPLNGAMTNSVTNQFMALALNNGGLSPVVLRAGADNELAIDNDLRVQGAVKGNGAGWTNLTAANLAGTIAPARMATNAASSNLFLRATSSTTAEWGSAPAGGSSSPIGGPDIGTARQHFSGFDDFLGKLSTSAASGQNGLRWDANGGTVSQNAGESTAPGILRLSTSASTTAGPLVEQFTDAAPISFTGGTFTNEWRIRLAQLPDAGGNANTFTNRIGYIGGNGSSEALDALYCRISTNASVFVLVGRRNGTESSTNTTTTVAANTWYKIRLVVNSDATLATMTINDSDPVTISGTTAIPQSGDPVSMSAQIVKQVGTTACTMDIDYAYLGYTLTTSR
jgi:hypothetical protein